VVHSCISQDCNQEWRLFGTGAVYALEKRATDGSPHHREFFWLCSSCIKRFAVCKDSRGRVVARPKSEVLYPTPPDPELDLRLVFRPTAHLARIEIIPEARIRTDGKSAEAKANQLEAVA
jgi:hypothetical protein